MGLACGQDVHLETAAKKQNKKRKAVLSGRESFIFGGGGGGRQTLGIACFVSYCVLFLSLTRKYFNTSG